LKSVKNQAVQAGKDYLAKQVLGQKDTTATKDSAVKSNKQQLEDKAKGFLKGLRKKN
jgi:hypothetical protein